MSILHHSFDVWDVLWYTCATFGAVSLTFSALLFAVCIYAGYRNPPDDIDA